ncbi:MAG: toll/interleukin-1 receptor domain-containing protein [Bacteroidota bacterium]|nr:toll/interleukin-1 receptor domain-containing protein [Bacteroidota bacterium]
MVTLRQDQPVEYKARIMMEYTQKEFDFFISHASEDKERFVKPLVKELKRLGFKVWYDEMTLKLGDSLFEEISNGIKNSNFGIVVISKSFLKKAWAKKELNGLINKEIITNSKVILPVWLDIEVDDVLSFSPLLADKVSISVKPNEIDKVIAQILSATNLEIIPRETILEQIDYLRNCTEDERNKYIIDTEARIKNLIYFQEAYYNWFTSDDVFEGDEWDDLLADKKRFELQSSYRLPYNVTYNSEFHPKNGMNEILILAKKWIRQKANAAEIYELIFLIDWYHELDLPYLLWGYPEQSLKDMETHNLCFTAPFTTNPKKIFRRTQIEEGMKEIFASYYSVDEQDISNASFEFLISHVSHEMIVEGSEK